MIDYKFQAVVTGSALEKDDRMMEVEQYSNDEDEFIYALPFDKKDDDQDSNSDRYMPTLLDYTPQNEASAKQLLLGYFQI